VDGMISYWIDNNPANGHDSDNCSGLFPFGLVASDIPFVADINGDGMDDIGLFRTTTGQWFANFTYVDDVTGLVELGQSTTGQEIQLFGAAGDTPLIGKLGYTCPGLDDDCDVDLLDIHLFAGDWLSPYDMFDFALLAQDWLLDCPDDPGCDW